jgi:isoleucyl-tRNA synthetase
MTRFPQSQELTTGLSAPRVRKWEELSGVRDAVLKALEEKRNAKEINSSLDARVILRAGGTMGDLLREFERELPELFIVSQVELAAPAPSGDHGAGLGVQVERARGRKCERCWNYSERVGESAEWPTVCERCVAALEKIARAQTA